MLVYIDESGDAGLKIGQGSSPFLVVAAVIFADRNEAQKCDDQICEIRRQLRMSPHKEFHFTSDNERIRTYFLTEVAKFDFRYSAFVLNKTMLVGTEFQLQESLYHFAARMVVQNVQEHLREATIVIDRCGDKEFRSELSQHIRIHVNSPDGVTRIRKAKMEKSHTNNLLQLADMTCGAIAKCYTSETSSRMKFRQLIRHREMRVEVLPTPSPGA